MGIATRHGETPWSAKEVGHALDVVPQAATRRMARFEDLLSDVLAGLRGLDPDVRPCDLAEMVVATLAAGGALARLDRQRLLRRVRQLAEEGRTR